LKKMAFPATCFSMNTETKSWKGGKTKKEAIMEMTASCLPGSNFNTKVLLISALENKTLLIEYFMAPVAHAIAKGLLVITLGAEPLIGPATHSTSRRSNHGSRSRGPHSGSNDSTGGGPDSASYQGSLTGFRGCIS
jgi:hypothetical protein